MTNELVAHLFRHEAGRMVSVLTRWLGFDRLELAEDIVQDALMLALQTWPRQGIPDNPCTWLYRVAKNRALDAVRRDKAARAFSSEAEFIAVQEPDEPMLDRLFLDDEITDSQLRMLFACCHPVLAFESQVAMCLKLLCGLSVREIAGAFLTSDETIAKRLYRAKERVRTDQIRLDVPVGSQLPARLDAVLRSLYLLFNEGYASSHPDQSIRQELCEEAMRLCHLLTLHPRTQCPAADALLALMCFQAARFEARTTDVGDLILLQAQDRSKWNKSLIDKGQVYLNRAATGNDLTDYHLEASIAALHALAPAYEATDWSTILHYYDLLLAQKPSPVVALHRAVALAEVAGPTEALAEVSDLSGLDHSQYYHAVLGDLYHQNQQSGPARRHYERAMALTMSRAEQALLDRKIALLQAV